MGHHPGEASELDQLEPTYPDPKAALLAVLDWVVDPAHQTLGQWVRWEPIVAIIARTLDAEAGQLAGLCGCQACGGEHDHCQVCR